MPKRPDITGMTFDEIAAKYGEEAAIQAGIAADPDTFELDEEWFKQARPASEVVPHVVESFHRTRAGRKLQLRNFSPSDSIRTWQTIPPEWEGMGGRHGSTTRCDGRYLDPNAPSSIPEVSCQKLAGLIHRGYQGLRLFSGQGALDVPVAEGHAAC